jgi:hypothetical protein
MGIEQRFAEAWHEERASVRSNLQTLELQRRDLRRARAPNISLIGADLSGAHLEEADLMFARLEGANLRAARLSRADLQFAQLQGAYLSEAWLDRAYLLQSHLQGANLSAARLRRADLSGAWLEDADLSEATLIGTDLRYADLRATNWHGTISHSSLLHYSDLRGAIELSQAQLEGSIGNEYTLLPLLPLGRDPLFVWSCWVTPPQGFDELVATAAGRFAVEADRVAVRAGLLCGPRNPLRKTGTPLTLDASYPLNHPLAARN